MTTILKIIKYQFHDTIRSKWLLVYTVFFLLLSYGLVSFTDDSSKVLLSMMNVVLIIIPLASIIFGTIFVYNNKEFIILMLSQPIKRSALYLGLFFGLVIPLVLSFLLGGITPLLFYSEILDRNTGTLIILIAAGIFETLIFSGMAFLIAISNENRMKGLGVSIFTWLLFAVLYDGFILIILQSFQDYPLEIPAIVLIMFNPVDLARILVILMFDVAALMGYTGAVFQKFFGNFLGVVISFIVLCVWSILPLLLGGYKFLRKDF